MSRRIMDIDNDKVGELFSKANDNFEEVYATDAKQDSEIKTKATQADFNTLKARVDNLTQTPARSTEGNAELLDIRVGADGRTYSTAGEAVRGQSNYITKYLENIRPASLIEGKFIYSDGERESSEGWRCTDYIPVEYGDRIIIGKTNGKNLPWVLLYDSNKEYLTMIYSSKTSADQLPGDTIILEPNARFARFNIFPSKNLDSSLDYLLLEHQAYYLDNLKQLLGLQLDLIQGNTKLLSNYHSMLDLDNICTDQILNYLNGELISNQYSAGYAVSDYIPVKQGDILSVGYARGKNLCAGCIYDSNKNYIRTIWIDGKSPKISEDINDAITFTVIDENAAYFRYNIVSDRELPRSQNYIIKSHDDSYNILHSNDNLIMYVGSNRTGELNFQTIKDCTEFIINNNIYNATVYVDPEEFDLESEYGSDYLDSINSSTNKGYGPHIGNNTHFIFAEGSRIKFNYSGSNEKCAEYFSAFNIVGSVILENADIEVSNARYCIHEDLPTSADKIPESTTVKYVNCRMNHKGDTIPSGSHSGYACIGAGTNRNTLSIVEGGKYTAAWIAPISYHNYYGSLPSRIIIRNACLDKSLRLADFGTNSVDVEVSNCKIPGGIIGSHTYFHITAWNNLGIDDIQEV